MRLEHVALYVQDLESMKEFYKKYFGAVENNMYHNKNTGLQTYFLTFDDGARLEIMTRPNLENNEKSQMSLGYIHLAFSLGSKEAVDELTTRLKNDGFVVISGPRTTGDGYYESCIEDPEKNLIEITA